MTTKTYDPQCELLAQYFLTDYDCGTHYDECVRALATEIQACVENELSALGAVHGILSPDEVKARNQRTADEINAEFEHGRRHRDGMKGLLP